MPTRTEQIEQTPIPLKLATWLIGVAVSAAVTAAIGWTVMSARVEQAQADIVAVKFDRAEVMKVWQQDRIDNAAFQSKVMTKLDAIDAKLGR